MDYAYTINGWMKAMNGTILNPGYELGRDNASGYLSQNTSVHNKFAKDVVGYTLGYFKGDYQSIGSTNFAPTPFDLPGGVLDAAISPMYNGNIAYTTTAIADVPNPLNPMKIQMGVYRYDQMNRLVSARTFRATGLAASNSWTGAAETMEYKSVYSYDPNGNITHLTRNGAGTLGLNMDDISYNFEAVPNTSPMSGTHASNRLDYVEDISSSYTQDIDDQDSLNYSYDRLGQLTGDVSEGMTIQWFSGSRKVKKITRSDKTIEFKYNPFGQRILKKVTNTGSGVLISNSYYAYDANGQVMGIYDINLTNNNATLNELNIYGASRIGMIDKDVIVCTAGVATAAPTYPSVNPTIHTLGYKKYEITNYLGNVNAVITDRKLFVSSTYEAVVIMNSDYYPFGMEMPDRHTNEQSYRFGYNGMEMDNEAKGNGNSYTTEFRQYDPRLGRWLSLDPLMVKYPGMSPYVAFNDNPVFFVDPLGLEGDPAPREEPRKKDYSSSNKDDPKVQKPSFLRQLGWNIMGDWHYSRARNLAAMDRSRESDVMEIDHNTTIVRSKIYAQYSTEDENGDFVVVSVSAYRYSIFRKAKKSKKIFGEILGDNDDLYLSIEELMKTEILSEEVLDGPDPVSGTVKGGITLMKAGESGFTAIIKGLRAYSSAQAKKLIRFGVGGHEDVLNKGFHVHIDGYKFELGLRAGHDGTVGFVKVGKKRAGTALDLTNATEIFSKALANTEFKDALLIHLKATQESLITKYKGMKHSQLAIDKAHEINYIIKAIQANY